MPTSQKQLREAENYYAVVDEHLVCYSIGNTRKKAAESAWAMDADKKIVSHAFQPLDREDRFFVIDGYTDGESAFDIPSDFDGMTEFPNDTDLLKRHEGLLIVAEGNLSILAGNDAHWSALVELGKPGYSYSDCIGVRLGKVAEFNRTEIYPCRLVVPTEEEVKLYSNR